MAKFEIDKRAFERLANGVLKKRAAEIQGALDGVYRSHAGRPVHEVRAALSSACRRARLTPDAEQVRSWSQTISEGKRIVLDVKTVRL